MSSINEVYSEAGEHRLSENARLWRYVPLRTLLFYLTGKLFFPAVESLRLEDPFEGQFHFDVVWFNSVMSEQYGGRITQVEKWIHDELCTEFERRNIELNKAYLNYAASIYERRYFEFLRETRFASCWFLSEAESAAMWNNYGKQGAAISTTVKKLSTVLSRTERDFEFGRMRYVRLVGGAAQPSDFNPEVAKDAKFLLKPHFIKRKEYESEQEVRFVTASAERECKGIVLEASPEGWIEEILLWPGLKPVEAESVKKVVDHFAPNVRCVRSSLLDASGEASGTIASLQSAFSEWDCRAWKDGSDGIPQEMKRL